MRKLFLLFLFGMFLISLSTNLVKADTQSLTMRFIIPEDDTTPEFDNLRNFVHDINTEFSKSITASSTVGISCYWLNDTTKFDVDCNGLIENVTALNSIETVYLRITVNNTLGEETYGDFYIDIRERLLALVCRYESFGYYNLELPFMKEDGCMDDWGYGNPK